MRKLLLYLTIILLYSCNNSKPSQFADTLKYAKNTNTENIFISEKKYSSYYKHFQSLNKKSSSFVDITQTSKSIRVVIFSQKLMQNFIIANPVVLPENIDFEAEIDSSIIHLKIENDTLSCVIKRNNDIVSEKFVENYDKSLRFIVKNDDDIFYLTNKSGDSIAKQKYSVSYLVPVSSDKNLVKNIISKITGQYKNTYVDIESAVKQDKENIKKEYYNSELLEDLDQMPDDDYWFLNWEYSMDMQVDFNADNLICLSFGTYYYQGGAHGGYYKDYLVYDTKNKSEIKLTDVLNIDKYNKEISTLIFDKLKNEEDLTDLMSISKALNSDNFIFHADYQGIYFIFNEYEIACYAAGMITVLVKWYDLKPYLYKNNPLGNLYLKK